MKYPLLKILISFALVFLLSNSLLNKHAFSQEINSEKELFEATQMNRQWPSYRGFYAAGYMNGTDLPENFDIESGENVKWNIEIPGMGLSCPVIWDNKIFITTAISEKDKEGYKTGMYGDIAPVNDTSVHRWMLYCIDKNSGDFLWERKMYEGKPSVKRHPKSSHANTSVATDGKHVVVFLGTEGLYCYDMEGELLWKEDFGLIMSAWHIVKSAEWEFCSSPLIFKDKVIIQADALNQAFVAVLELETGKISWKKERDEIPGWCTPNIYFEANMPRIVVNGYKHRGAYDFYTGEEIWKMDGGGDIPVPTPVVWKDLVFFNSAHGKHRPLMAVKNTSSGEIKYPKKAENASEEFAWFSDRLGAYMSSVLVYEDLLYQIKWNGTLSCFDPRSGEEHYSENIETTSFIASPVAADGKIYLVSENGTAYIVKAGTSYELLEEIPLGEVSLVTPAIVEDMIVYRTAGRLIGVGK
jgi:outer membrane protein assembly factor BamB